jgi:hypothetical protein
MSENQQPPAEPSLPASGTVTGDVKEQENRAKGIAFYGSMVNAWVGTRMERDKTLLTVSSAGLGLLATLATKAGPSTGLEFAFYLMAGASFLTTIICGVLVLGKNADHIEAVIAGNNERDKLLDFLDRIIFWGFILGVLLTGAIGASAAFTHLEEVNHMKYDGIVASPQNSSNSVGKSLSGAGRLDTGNSSGQNGSQTGGSAAGQDQGRSLSGVGNLGSVTGSTTAQTGAGTASGGVDRK